MRQINKPLSALRKHDSGIIETINLDEKNAKKFASLGIVKGARVTVKQQKNPMLLDVAGTSVAIGNKIAEKIEVKSNLRTILLTGNPNVGKSMIFSRLTGVKAVSSNFPGTTVAVKESEASFKGRNFSITDVPGIYRLENESKAEQEASEILKKKDYDMTLYVLEATHLERSLFLALEILALGKPVVFLLNKYSTAKANGIQINAKELSRILGAPVVRMEAATGLGFKNLEKVIARQCTPEALEEPRSHASGHAADLKNDDDKWKAIGHILAHVQTLEHKHPTFLQRLADSATRPLTGIPIAVVLMIISFFIVRYAGEGLIDLLTPLFEGYYVPFIEGLVGSGADSWWGILLIGQGEETFGILTTALQVALIDVLSYVFIFYIVFEFWADLGYLPRLSILLDSMLHKIGLHGYGAIPIMMGLGCKVPAVMGTRMLETKREKIIALALILIMAPCISQTAMIISILAPYSMWYTVSVFATLLAVGIAAGYALNKIMKGNPTELFMEVPAWQVPKIKPLSQKVWVHLKEYLKEAVPMIILGILIINLLDQAGLLSGLADFMRYPVEKIMGLPSEATPVIMLGALRKDVSIALLEPFNMLPHQLTIASVFMSMYVPCVATFFVMLKEAGVKDTFKIVFLTCSAAFLVAALMNIVFKIIL